MLTWCLRLSAKDELVRRQEQPSQEEQQQQHAPIIGSIKNSIVPMISTIVGLAAIAQPQPLPNLWSFLNTIYANATA